MTPAAVRAVLDQAAAVASRQGDVRAVVILIGGAGTLTVVGDPADRAALPAGLRLELEAAMVGRTRTLCSSCAGRTEDRR